MIKDFNVTETLEKISVDNTSNENKVRYVLFSLKTPSEKCELLMKLMQSIPTTFWVELVIGCIDEMSADNQKKLCKQITAIFHENKNFKKADSIKLFKQIEEKAVSMGLHKTPLSTLIPKAARFFNRSINDNRYKLFADYGHVYYTSDIDELKTDVIKLNELYVNGESSEIVRCYAYLLTIAQFRLARLLYPKEMIRDYTLSDANEACFNQDNDCCDDRYNYENDDDDNNVCNLDLDSDDDYWEDSSNTTFHYISNISKRIISSGCIEIVRIFDPHLYYIDAELLRKIHAAVSEVTEKNRYENVADPIVSENCLFVINPDN